MCPYTSRCGFPWLFIMMIKPTLLSMAQCALCMAMVQNSVQISPLLHAVHVQMHVQCTYNVHAYT